MPDKPTHEQGQLQLQLYDLRREAKLRQARDWFVQNYFVDTFEDSQRIAPFGSQEGTYVMMVLSYWEQACAFLNHGLLHEQLFFETSGEFFWRVGPGQARSPEDARNVSPEPISCKPRKVCTEI